MDATYPRISIITPSFNQGAFLEQTILSVLQQCYADLEYIIIDGNSTDNSTDIIRRYESELNYWESQPDRGQTHALNKGFSRATGDIIAWLNSDDYYEPGCFEQVVSLFKAQPGADLISGSVRAVDEGGNHIRVFDARSPDYYPLLHHSRMHRNGLKTVIPHQPSVFMRRNVMASIGRLNESLHYSMDYDLWLSCIENGFRFHVTNEILSNYRFHDGSKSNQGWQAFMDEWERVSLEHKLRLSPARRFQAEMWWKAKKLHLLLTA